ncbi:MAG TPA: hypothetical protein VM943_05475 [Pyrinomonadaceae bacterium]|nr:hypothetical protein [Pyrinomonadaceae bacterium]
MSGFIHTIAVVVVRFALVLTLFGAGWNIYRRLPEGDTGSNNSAANRPGGTIVRLMLRPAPSSTAPVGTVTFQLYPIDVTAEQRKFDSKPQAGVRFDDFLIQQMGKKQSVKGQFDERGEAAVSVPPGKWWVLAELKGAQQNISWRLPPVSISGRERVIELTPENSYTRAKSF